jgi:hypothetical protein
MLFSLNNQFLTFLVGAARADRQAPAGQHPHVQRALVPHEPPGTTLGNTITVTCNTITVTCNTITIKSNTITVTCDIISFTCNTVTVTCSITTVTR